jgi:hypothetical protein
MRQQQEGLAFWLRPKSGAAPFRERLGTRLGTWLRIPALASTVTEVAAIFETAVVDDPVCQEMPHVLDALPFLLAAARQDSTEIEVAPHAQRGGASFGEVKSVELSLLRAAPLLRDLSLLKWPEIREGLVRVLPRRLRVFAPTLVPASPRVTNIRGGILPLESKVLSHDLRQFPYMRPSVELDALSVPRAEGLARQAESLQAWENGRAEVVAYFSRVPVELLSRVRFVQDRRQLVYYLHSARKVTKTRIHDLIAVRDRKSGDVHFVPERTSFRIATLDPKETG